jgi:hypothetical protein
MYLAEESTNARSFTVYVYTILANLVHMHTATGAKQQRIQEKKLLGLCIPAKGNTVYTRSVYLAGNHQMYGHIRCMYTQFWPTLLTIHAAGSTIIGGHVQGKKRASVTFTHYMKS